MELSHYGVEAMPKLESFPIDKIYVPVKRKKALKPELVQEIAESILKIGQQAPILVRPDEGRFVLVEGLHRFEACKALGEKTIIGVLVSAEIVHQKTVLSDSAAAERDKMARLKRLRLEKEAAARLAAASEPVTEMQSAELLRKPSEKGIRNNRKASGSQLGRRASGSTPRTLSEWLTQQKRDGNRY
jgi:ParB-like chromosome segregation protein Spo0J